MPNIDPRFESGVYFWASADAKTLTCGGEAGGGGGW